MTIFSTFITVNLSGNREVKALHDFAIFHKVGWFPRFYEIHLGMIIIKFFGAVLHCCDCDILPDEKGAVARPAAGVSRCAGAAVASPRSSAPRPSERGGGGRGRGRAVWARRGPVGDGNRI